MQPDELAPAARTTAAGKLSLQNKASPKTTDGNTSLRCPRDGATSNQLPTHDREHHKIKTKTV